MSDPFFGQSSTNSNADTSNGLIAAGGSNAELYIGALTSASSGLPPVQRIVSTKLSGPRVSINNSLLLTQNNFTPAPPYAHWSNIGRYGEFQGRLFVSNNDESIKVFNIVLPESNMVDGTLSPAGTLRVQTPVNHSERLSQLGLDVYFLHAS